MVSAGSLVCNFFLGPLLIYLVLMGHVLYQVAVKTPDDLTVPAWPSHATKQEKEAIIRGRKVILNDLLTSGHGWAEAHCTEDVELEDPFQKSVGMEEVSAISEIYHTLLIPTQGDDKPKVLGEHHAPHETILELEVKRRLPYLPNVQPLTMLMRIRFMWEPPSTKGGPEKVFRMSLEWGGNPTLNERTVSPSLLGKIHSKLRRFTGYAISAGLQKLTAA